MKSASRWRKRALPAIGILLIGLLWGVGVYAFEVPEYIIPSPWLVATTLARDFRTILANLVPTAIESLAGFVIGNVASIVIATIFVHQKTVQEAFFPIAILFGNVKDRSS